MIMLGVTLAPPSAVIQARGSVDYCAAGPLRAVLAEVLADADRVTVDLTGVNLLDAHSLGILVAARRRALARHGDLRLRGATGRVLRVLEISGEDKWVEPPTAHPAGDRGEDRTVEILLRARLRQPGGAAQREGLRQLAIARAYDLATALARTYRGRGEPLEDLTQVAMIGLIRAVDGYEPERGPGFSAYAVPTILGELRRYFRDKGWHVRVPRRLQELGQALPVARETLTQRLGRSATAAELAAHLEVPEEEVLAAIDAAQVYRPGSLYAPARSVDSGAVLVDQIGTVDQRFELVDDRESLRGLLAELPERHRRILALRFYEDLTQSQIAARLGVSQMHISRLLSEVLARLRCGLTAE